MLRQHQIQSTGHQVMAVAISLAFVASAWADDDKVSLPAGSVDGLAAAIAQAGPHGTVIVESGWHQESSTVVVDIPVTIIGEAGAVIEGATVPNLDGQSPDFIDPVLHIYRTRGAEVRGITIQPAPGAVGNTAVLIQDSPKATVRENTLVDHEFGIVVQHGDQARIDRNRIENMLLFGVVSINGQRVKITRNEIVGIGVYGFWLCDYEGQCKDNSISQAIVGALLCRFGDGLFILPDGSAEGAGASATGWLVNNNNAFDNQDIGYLVTDGANNNRLINNAASNNGFVDILLDEAFEDPPDYFPPSFENVVVLGKHKEISVLDLGVDNVIKGRGQDDDDDEDDGDAESD